METVIGTCSICGGQVTSWHGPWMGVTPPPGPTCRNCGAVKKGSRPVIEMEPSTLRPSGRGYWDFLTDYGTNTAVGIPATLPPMTSITDALNAAFGLSKRKVV